MNGTRTLRDRLSPIALVIRLTGLDFFRRKDFYVLAIFMLLFVIATVVIRIIGIDRASTARFLMSGGLNLSHLLAAILAASFAGRCFPEEFDRGTLMPLLAKPISRGEVLAGKLAACLALTLGTYALFVVATLLAVPFAPGQSVGAFAQVVVLQMTALAMLAAMAMAISLYLPTLVAALISLGWYFCSGFVLNTVKQSAAIAYPNWASFAERAVGLFPDPTQMFHVEMFSGGARALGGGLFVALWVYGLAWGVAFAFWAGWRFERVRL